MSILLNGTDQWAHRDTFPDMSLGWSMVAWARRDEPASTYRVVAGLGAASFANRQSLVYLTNRVRAGHNVEEIFAGLWPDPGLWAYCFLTYSGGTLRLRSALAGASDWDGTIGSLGGLSNLTPDSFVVGSGVAGSANNPYLGPIAFVKTWEGRVLTDSEAWAEREYRLPVNHSADVWEAYKFDSGALATGSVNGRTLTLVGSPTYTADEPSDILGDSPGGQPTFLRRRIVQVSVT